MYIESRGTGGWSIISVLTGGVGFILSWIPLLGILLGDILGIIAVVTGIVGCLKPGGRGLAIVGLVLGVLTLLLKSTPIVRWL